VLSRIGRPPPKTPMVFDLLQARRLYLAEGLELCQQMKERLLILTHSPTPLAQQKLMQWIGVMQKGALTLELTDIQLFTTGIAALLETYSDPSSQFSVIQELLHHLCDGLQLSFIAYSAISDPASASDRRDLVLHSLIPKVLEIFEIILTQLPLERLQSQLLIQQVKWMQFWSQSLDLKDLSLISSAALSGFETFPQSIIAIAPVALAGFRVAYEAILRSPSSSSLHLSDGLSSHSNRKRYPCELGLKVFNTAQHLVGLADRTVFCVATESIAEIAIYETSQILHHDGRDCVVWRDRQLPLHQFVDLWEPSTPQSLPLTQQSNAFTILMIEHEAQIFAVALEVERLIVEPNLELNPVASPPESSLKRCCYGITTLGDRLEIEVVDVNCLLSERLLADTQATAQWPTSATKALSSPQQSIIPPLPKTILIVDDSKTLREILTLTLEGAGYSVLQAPDGQQALEYLEHQAKIHLIVCDLEMSNLNGFEFLRHRLQDPRWLKIPVVILSSHTEAEYRQLSKKLGAADYFTIPYDRASLVQSIETLLRADSNANEWG
jgi:CheY-like chemotaxis protein